MQQQKTTKPAVFGALFFSPFGCCEWLLADATEGEEEHEVALLWVAAGARAFIFCKPGAV